MPVQAELIDLVGLADADLPELISTLAARGITVATAESLTGGLLAAVLTEVPGASAVLRGGLVVYATDLKHTLAGVDLELLHRRGPVDADVACQLAAGARLACGSTVGIGLTGVAGPDRQNDIPVGSWFVAIADSASAQVVAGLPEPVWTGRAQVRHAAIRAAINLLKTYEEHGRIETSPQSAAR